MATLSNIQLNRFELRWDPEDQTLNLYHTPCGRLIGHAPVYDNLTLMHWVKSAQSHKEYCTKL